MVSADCMTQACAYCGAKASNIAITSTASTFNSMCVEQLSVLEQAAKRQSDVAVLISFRAGRKRASVAQNVAPKLNQSGVAVARKDQRQCVSNRRHDCHLRRLSRRDAGDDRSISCTVPESVVSIDHLSKLIAQALIIQWNAEVCPALARWRTPMPRYYFDIKDGHRFVDPSGWVCENDRDAIQRAKVIAIGVSLDKPEIDPTRHVAVLNEAKVEIFKVRVYSRPAA
jgi:hypothetical protein